MDKTFNANSFVNALFDAVTIARPNDTTEVYSYRQGGVDGTVVCTLTIVYTDETKENISSVARS
jgi:hypothetical protein